MNCCKASAKLLSGFLLLSLISGYGQTVGQDYVLNGAFVRTSSGPDQAAPWVRGGTTPPFLNGGSGISGENAMEFTGLGTLSETMSNVPFGNYDFSFYYEPQSLGGNSITLIASVNGVGTSTVISTGSSYLQFTETVSYTSGSGSIPLLFEVTSITGGTPSLNISHVAFTYQSSIPGPSPTPSNSGGLTAVLSAKSQAEGWTLVNNVNTATLGTQIAQGASGGTSGGSSGGDSGQESVTIDALTTEYNSLNAEFSTNVMKKSPTSSCEYTQGVGCSAKDTPGEVS